MNEPVTSTTSSDTTSEHKRSEVERSCKNRELSVKERECDLKETELEIKKLEHAISPWKSPLIVTILAATVAAFGNAAVGYLNANSQRTLEAQKAEQARILEMIKTGNADTAAENLQFLLDAGLIVDSDVHSKLTKFLANRDPGSGPALPSPSMPNDVIELMSQFEENVLKPYIDPFGVRTIGIGHNLTIEELNTGKLVIDGKLVNYRLGITQEQSMQLLEQDLETLSKDIDNYVDVKLTDNQRGALASFVFQVGLGNFRNSTLRKKLNLGKYDEVPLEMKRWVKNLGETNADFVRRREAEIDLWNKP